MAHCHYKFVVVVIVVNVTAAFRSGSFAYENWNGSFQADLPRGPDVSAEVILDWMLSEVKSYCMINETQQHCAQHFQNY